jgi:hypothetical protein
MSGSYGYDNDLSRKPVFSACENQAPLVYLEFELYETGYIFRRSPLDQADRFTNLFPSCHSSGGLTMEAERTDSLEVGPATEIVNHDGISVNLSESPPTLAYLCMLSKLTLTCSNGRV